MASIGNISCAASGAKRENLREVALVSGSSPSATAQSVRSGHLLRVDTLQRLPSGRYPTTPAFSFSYAPARLAALHIGIEALGNLIPGVDVAADVAMVADIALTVAEFRKLAIDAAAALDFVDDGPHSLEDLQASSNYEEFPSYREFLKDGFSLGLILKIYGSAGEGNQYHHIVTQGGLNEKNIPPEQLQNTDNIIRLPTLLHEAVNGAYLKDSPDPNMNMYQWLQTQPYDIQRKEGLKILRELRILK